MKVLVLISFILSTNLVSTFLFPVKPIPVKTYVRSFKSENISSLADIKVTEPYFRSNRNTSAIVFFTGGNNVIIDDIYKNFLHNLAYNHFSVYTPSFRYSNYELLAKQLYNEYQHVLVIGHSSGAVPAINFCKNNFDKIYLSTGTANKKEIENVHELFDGWQNQLIVMHCVSSYPCTANNINLPRILHLREFFENVGFSDHTQGIKSTISSINLNPVAIEKHFTIDKDLPGRDNKFAILPEEMKFLSEYIHVFNSSMIDHGIDYQEIETSSRNSYRGRFDG